MGLAFAAHVFGILVAIDIDGGRIGLGGPPRPVG